MQIARAPPSPGQPEGSLRNSMAIPSVGGILAAVHIKCAIRQGFSRQGSFGKAALPRTRSQMLNFAWSAAELFLQRKD